jgi:hypothetical protein
MRVSLDEFGRIMAECSRRYPGRHASSELTVYLDGAYGPYVIFFSPASMVVFIVESPGTLQHGPELISATRTYGGELRARLGALTRVYSGVYSSISGSLAGLLYGS